MPETHASRLRWILAAGGIALGIGAYAAYRHVNPAVREVTAGKEKVPAAVVNDSQLTILYPFEGAVFPPEITAPTFRWQDSRADSQAWRLTVDMTAGGDAASSVVDKSEWTPADDLWDTMKQCSRQSPISVLIEGLANRDAQQPLSSARVSFRTSPDPVGAPLFFREVNLPFLTAVKDPAAHIRWRFGEISSKGPPPIVLEKLPVCGNCHSFSADGSTLAMEVDSGNDKGAYAIVPVAKDMVLDPDRIITWSDFRREDNDKTFGLLCQASPDGRYIVGTVKDRALAVYRPDLAFSQLFFLVKGILAIYDRQTETFSTLRGADDPNHVQTNATWSPDGKTLVFARSRDPAYDPPSLRKYNTVLVPQREADEFLQGGRTFQYDLYRIPFNEGQGGVAEPIVGAANNGMSNYFAKFSPDGKWIVFCKAKSFMLLQPDSELYIIPAAGGEARRLACNLDRMNSWHSWSPNSKWLVFSSKMFSVYTQLFLTHIDELGESSPPVLLENFTAENRAANIPEFANVKPRAIEKITERFLDDVNYLRVGDAFRLQGEHENAIGCYRRAVELNPDNALVYANWGTCLLQLGKLPEAIEKFQRSVALDPKLPEPLCSLGLALRQQNRPAEAAQAYERALQAKPDFALAHLHLGTLLQEQGQFDGAKQHLQEAVRLDPADSYARYNLGVTLNRTGDAAGAAEHLAAAIERDANFVPALISLALIRATSNDPALRNGQQAVALATRARDLTQGQNAEALFVLATAYAVAGNHQDAAILAEAAMQRARAVGNVQLVEAIRQSFQVRSPAPPVVE